MRLDLLLKSLCLVKTRSQGRKGCEAGRVKLNGSSSKPSREVHSGDIIEIQFPGKTLVVEVSDIPAGQVSRKKAEEYYRVVRETMRGEAPDRRL
jgi:ribosome-associated heat shock protein Hsp15